MPPSPLLWVNPPAPSTNYIILEQPLTPIQMFLHSCSFPVLCLKVLKILFLLLKVHPYLWFTIKSFSVRHVQHFFVRELKSVLYPPLHLMLDVLAPRYGHWGLSCFFPLLFLHCLCSHNTSSGVTLSCWYYVWPMDKMTVNRPHFRHVTDILIFHHFWQLLHFPAIIDISIHIKCLWVSPCVCNVFRPPPFVCPRGQQFSVTELEGDKQFVCPRGQTFLTDSREGGQIFFTQGWTNIFRGP